MVSTGKRGNYTDKVVNDKMIEDPKVVKKEIAKHFAELYKKNGVLEVDVQDCDIRMLSQNAMTSFEVPITEKEVWDTICGCEGSKAPGLDGYNMNFYKKQ